MLYYIIISLPFLIYYGLILLTNYVIPHFKKKSLFNQMKGRTDAPDIEKTLHLLKKLFKRNYAKITSLVFRNIHYRKNKEFTYGEIDFLSFYNILEKTKPKPKETFYDLGSGAGKAVFAAGLFFDLSKSCGIELLPALYKKANNTLKKTTLMLENIKANYEATYLKRVNSIQFINANFLDYNFSDAHIIYIAATCLSEQTWNDLIIKLAHLKPDTRVIVATKTIQHDYFELIYKGIELMSWGLCPVSIYKIKPKLSP